MKDSVSDFAGIIENEIKNFCERNNLVYNEFYFDEKTNEESIRLSFGGFDVHFYIGDNLSYGFRLFEDTDLPDGYCMLTRFKFLFSPFYYSPYDIHNILDCRNFEALDFHNLNDDDDVKKAICAVLCFIENNKDKIAEISGNLLLQKQLKDNYEHDMSIVSKKITAENLKENFRKYAEKHELNLYFHGRADLSFYFASNDKYKELDKYFSSKSKKNKLTVFEQRLYKHLDENGYEPVSESVKFSVEKQVKSNKKNLFIEIPSYIIAAALEFLVLIVTEKLYLASLPDGLYYIIGSSVNAGFSFLVGLISIKYIITAILEFLFFKKVHPSEKHAKIDKKATAVLLVICFIVAVGNGIYNYFFNINSVAIHDNGIYVGTQAKNEIVPFDSDRVEFFLIEGYTDYDENNNEIYTDSIDEKEIYIVIDGDYDEYFSSADENTEQLLKTINLLKEKGIELIEVKDYITFENTYVSP